MPLKSKTHAWPSRAAHEREKRITHAPVSHSEREHLKAFRATPSLETHLTPTGPVTKDVTNRVEAERERRIGYITKRLDGKRDLARDGFNRSR